METRLEGDDETEIQIQIASISHTSIASCRQIKISPAVNDNAHLGFAMNDLI